MTKFLVETQYYKAKRAFLLTFIKKKAAAITIFSYSIGMVTVLVA